jgi:hypothetical protein
MESENVKIVLFETNTLKKSLESIKKCIEFTISNNDLDFDDKMTIFCNYKMILSSFDTLDQLQKMACQKK